MAARKEVKLATVYEEFEPFCKWKRNEDHDILEIHLQDFKKEELKVQISNNGVLKISGERELDESKRTKFYKEVAVPLNKYDTHEIHAKFMNSNLILTIPKLKLPVPQTNEKVPSSEPTTSRFDQAPKPGPTMENNGTGAKEPIVSTGWRFESWKRKMMGLRTVKVAGLAAGLAATSAAVAVLAAAYVVYMYKSTVQEIDE